MSFHYEVVADSALTGLFRRKFLENVSRTKCCEMFRLVAPGMPALWEFKTGKDIFTISFGEEANERTEKLAIDSMTLDLTETIVLTMQSCVTEYLFNFLAPLSKVPVEELEKRVKKRIEGLQGMLLPQTLWELNSSSSVSG